MPFEDDLLEELEGHIEEELGFHVLDHELKFYGQCQECRLGKKAGTQEKKDIYATLSYIKYMEV